MYQMAKLYWKEILKISENCITAGKWLIITDCTETLNPTLEPILNP